MSGAQSGTMYRLIRHPYLACIASKTRSDSRRALVVPPLGGSRCLPFRLKAEHQRRNMSDIRTFTEIAPTDGPAVGGKGLSLGLMTRAGLPVPRGFCIVSEVHRRHGSHAIPEELRSAIEAAYGKLGRDLVAVRSSATAE